MTLIWNRFGLARTPFFQEPLEEGAQAADLARFFVGRDRDRAACITALSHDEQTRVVMVGDPGVGKTTLMNRVIADLRTGESPRPAWLVPASMPINLPGATTLTDFCVEVLRHVLDMRTQHQQSQQAQRGGARKVLAQAKGLGVAAKRAVVPGQDLWEQVTRVVRGATTLAPQIAGFGLSGQRTGGTVSIAAWVPLVRQALEQLVADTGCDLLIAVNNAENMARDTASNAAVVLQDARDVFMVPHVHWLFVGTPDFHSDVIVPTRQLAGIMQHPVVLAPLTADDIRELINKRYEALRVNGQVMTPPVPPDTVAALARIFIGDLRELLRALESAVLSMAPLGTGPLDLDTVMRVASQQQSEFLAGKTRGAAWIHLQNIVLGSNATARPYVIHRFREADAVRILAPMRQPTVHSHKKQWLEDRLVRPERRSGASEWLTVTGTTLLAMLPEAIHRGYTSAQLLGGVDMGAQPAVTPLATTVQARRAGKERPKKK